MRFEVDIICIFHLFIQITLISGHKDRVQRMRNYITQHKLPLTLSGNSFDGVGVNDAIFSAKNGVELALKGSQ